MKIRPVGTKLFHTGQTEGRTDGQMDRHDEANSAFRNFAKAPNN